MHVEPSTCPVCETVFDPLRARALIVEAGRVRAFCSDDCRTKAELGESAQLASSVPPAQGARAWVYALTAGVLCIAAATGVFLRRTHQPAAHAAAPKPVVASTPPFSMADALRFLETKAESEVGTAGVPERDLWLHPLAGPERRLPVRDTRRFRAPREGLRPDECGSGHCGVDLGDQTGEWVFAAHDGVVERVQRDDVGNGGRYVRLNHRGGTLTTSYMHLGDIRSDLQAGTPVRAGDPLGTIGMSGINHSGPHVHFQIGVRAHPDDVEVFIDPEPLLHLWPLRPPFEQKPRHLARSPRVTASGPQGM
jgi:murein DD-endopeptidase MepM/ murein hydrolase activator NlpD